MKAFMEDVILYVVKGLLPLKIIKCIWFERLVYILSPRVIFAFQKDLAKKVLLALV
jgi:hypothetical protein